MQEKPKYLRKLFISWWLPFAYDAWVWIAVLGKTKNLRNNLVQCLPRGATCIIDLATGTGEEAMAMQQRFPNATLYASDLSERMLEVAKKKAQKQNLPIHFSIQDAVHTAYPAGKADIVSISFAIHDLPREQRKEVMKEAFRLLRPGGVFAIYEYHAPKNFLLWVPIVIQFLLVENLEAWSILKENLGQELKEAGFANSEKKIFYAGLAQVVIGKKS